MTPSSNSTNLTNSAPQAVDTPQLLDIHLPGDPSWWPPAPGWWLLALLLTGLLVWALVWLRTQRKKRRKIRQISALLEPVLERLITQHDTHSVAELNTLLRQLALIRYPREDIASLTGKQWLTFLDRSGKTSGFSQGAGKVLAELPYQAQSSSASPLSESDAKALVKLVRHWLKHSGVLA